MGDEVDSFVHESLRDHGRHEVPLVAHDVVALHHVQRAPVEPA